MFALRLVQHGSQLTGTAQYLLTVSSKRAGDDACCTTIDENGNAVPITAKNSTDLFTGRSDNGACDGTSACFESLNSAITGQMGAGDRVSITLAWGTRVFGNQTLIAKRSGNTLVFDVNGAPAVFHPADERAIQRAYAGVFKVLRTTVIPTANLDQEAQYLGDHVGLDQDVSGLQSIVDSTVNFTPGFLDAINPYVCDFKQSFDHQIALVQKDLNGEAAEIQKARALLRPYSQKGSALLGYGDSTGNVAELNQAIKNDITHLDGAVTRSNNAIAEANAHKGEIMNWGNAAGCVIQRYGEVLEHISPNLMAAG